MQLDQAEPGKSGGLVSINLLAFAIALPLQNTKGIRNKAKAALRPTETNADTISGRVISGIGSSNYLILFGVFLVLFLSWASGEGSAANQKVFYEASGTNRVLVAKDGGNLILESVVRHRLTGTLFVLPESESRLLELVPRSIGPLSTPGICVRSEC